jgi:hypothetical protein
MIKYALPKGHVQIMIQLVPSFVQRGAILKVAIVSEIYVAVIDR